LLIGIFCAVGCPKGAIWPDQLRKP